MLQVHSFSCAKEFYLEPAFHVDREIPVLGFLCIKFRLWVSCAPTTACLCFLCAETKAGPRACAFLPLGVLGFQRETYSARKFERPA